MIEHDGGALTNQGNHMKKPTRKSEFDIHYGSRYQHKLAAHTSSAGKVFWPLPGGSIVTRQAAAASWAAAFDEGKLR